MGIALEVSASAFKQFAFIGAAMSDVMIFVGGALLVVAMRTLFRFGFIQFMENTRIKRRIAGKREIIRKPGSVKFGLGPDAADRY